MVERQLRRRGIRDERVLEAMARGAARALRPRAPAPPRLRRLGAADRRTSRRSPSPGSSRRSARALELSGDERVLEVGTGSGYSAAVLARLAARGGQHRADSRARRAGRRERSPSSGSTNVEVRGRRRQPRGARPGAVRGDRRPRHGAGAAARACSTQLADRAARLVVPIAGRRCRHADRPSALAATIGIDRRPA